ncbi:MAG: XRE family transcriptional regulator [Clostridiales bacterium]|jgi:ACT domain-containing protein|nr:XRE family transcriptional regulator [Clostridiales bacterium]
MINVKKLKEKLYENKLTICEAAEKIGISKSTFYRKLKNGGDGFLVREVNVLASLLNMSSAEATVIFFANNFADTKKRNGT